MKTRILGEVQFAPSETGSKGITWEGKPSIGRETMHVHVVSIAGNGTWSSGIFGSIADGWETPETASVAVGSKIFTNVPNLPSNTIVISMTVAPTVTQTIRVAVVE